MEDKDNLENENDSLNSSMFSNDSVDDGLDEFDFETDKVVAEENSQTKATDEAEEQPEEENNILKDSDEISQKVLEDNQKLEKSDSKEDVEVINEELNDDVQSYSRDVVTKIETFENRTETKEENYVSTLEDFEEEENAVEELITVRPIKFQNFDETPPNRTIKKNLDIMQDVQMHISVELGRTKSTIRDVMELEKGSIVELDKIAGEQVEIFVNDKFVAKGEVIVIEDKFGVRVTSTNIAKVIQ